ncbi:MAG: Rrf2 family transcriptional regulator [Oscillospiraceae bacterium]
MIISTKGRYALRVMIDLAQHEGEGNISIKEISERQNISAKYLESIVSLLIKGHVLRSRRGKDGGYTLNRPADKITVGEIVMLTEGKLSPVQCLECADNTCERSDNCLTLPMWEKLCSMIDGYLGSVTIRDIIDGNLNNSNTEDDENG